MPLSGSTNPLTTDTQSELFLRWEKTLSIGETCSTFFYPISGNNYRISGFIEWYKKKKGHAPTVVNLVTDNTEESDDLNRLLAKAKNGLIVKPAEILIQPHMKNVPQHSKLE